MKVVLDATPMLGTRTGIGIYTSELLSALSRMPETESGELSLAVTTFSARAHRVLDLPVGVRQVGARLPARALRAAWSRVPFPPIELIAGRCSVFHGTNFIAPPTIHAASVITVHDLTYDRFPETVTTDVLAYRRFVAHAIHRGAHVLTPTEAVADQVRELYGLVADRVHATPLGVDPIWSTALPLSKTELTSLGLPARFVLFVGSLDPRKNLAALIAAHSAAIAADPDFPPLILAGPAGRAEGLDAPGLIRTGWLEDELLRRVVASSAGLALPSLDEGFGLPLIEALSCGRPVLASSIPVLREVAGNHAVFAEPSVAGLLDGLQRLMFTPDDEEARTARRAWASRFTWEATARGTLSTYRAAAA